MRHPIDFDGIKAAALRNARSLLPDLIPGGKFRSLEYIVRNPRRVDRKPGSFSINYRTGQWADFATSAKGGDIISWYAHARCLDDQAEAARQIAERLGVPLYKANRTSDVGAKSSSGGLVVSRPTAAQAPLTVNETTEPVANSALWGEDGPPRQRTEIRRHFYPVKVKIKRKSEPKDTWVTWYRVFRDGAPIGWLDKKPNDYRAIPYVTAALNPFDPKLKDDQIYWTEGEKDTDACNRNNLPAFTFGGVGDGLPDGIERYLKDRHLIIPAHNDDPGRRHAEEKARRAHDAEAASIKIIHFPELQHKGDVADFFERGGSVEQLVRRIEDALPWSTSPPIAPDAEAVKIDDGNETDAAIKRLAKLTPIEYERERKSAAEKLGIGRVSVLDNAVKAARGENGDTKGQGRPLELPTIEPWPEPLNGADLLDDICNAVKRYLVLPEGSAEVLALWATHTHAFECFEHSPRLAITSPEKGCGKTTTLDVLGELVARALPTSNATTAAIFRTIEKAKPTLLIDEADTFLGENEGLRGVLNAGHRRGGEIIRTVGDDHEPRQFSTWGSAAIAMIGRLPDTLEDRSVSIALRRRRPTEKVQQFRSDRVQDLKQLARKIARWCDDNRQNLAAHDPNTGTLVNRAADNWRPLLSIADLAGGRWPERARAVAEAAETAKQDQSKRTMVLSDIRDIFAARPETDRLRSAEMAEALGAMENRPWSEWRNGKPMTPAALARLLAPFGITPGTKREGEATFKGYLLSAFRRHLPRTSQIKPSHRHNPITTGIVTLRKA
jgi:hypothetical protein